MAGIVEGVFTWIDYFLVRYIRCVGHGGVLVGRLDVQ
jgi:hypothetical protein